MNRKKPYLYKRVIAYIIDLIIVTLLSGILTIIFTNNEEYNKDTQKLTELVNNVVNSEITQEEYMKQFDDLNYDLTLHSVDVTIITIGVSIVYYVIMCYFCHGITLGKYFMKLRIVCANEKEINIFNYLCRSLIINMVLVNTLNVVMIKILDKQDYINVYSKVGNVLTLLLLVSFIFMMYRDDGRGLHDLIGNTKIVNLSDIMENEDSSTIQEASVIDEKKKNSKKKSEDKK